MDVLIFNSGYGKRMGDLIKNSHKCLLDVYGEKLITRQLRILSKFNIERVIITTGPANEMVVNEVNKNEYPFELVFVHSNEYMSTNYIYSMYLCRELLINDTVILHGDLVFNRNLVSRLLNDKRENLVIVDSEIESYDKDFKALTNEKLEVKYISTKIENPSYGLQPLYKLSSKSVINWMNQVEIYIINGKTSVYAEDALNDILKENINLEGVLIGNDYCSEIDNPKDYKKILKDLAGSDFNQTSYVGDIYFKLQEILSKDSRVLVVYFSAIKDKISLVFKDYNFVNFIEYNESNPDIDDILVYKSHLIDTETDYVISIGGGSVIDFSKVLIHNSKSNANHIAIPTTCGTGSESTHFAVYYENDKKYSLKDKSLLPEYLILDFTFLITLPKKILISSVLDAFSQAIESFWSRSSSIDSKKMSLKALKIIVPLLRRNLLDLSDTELENLLIASNYSGKAINLTTTTAAHAFSYNITKMFNVPHGIAVCKSILNIWEYHMLNIEDFEQKMEVINNVLGYTNSRDTIEELKTIFQNLDVNERIIYTQSQLDYLVSNVNIERLGNNPYKFNMVEIRDIYLKSL
ncbi:iron-containing alcohol dehydrogenase [Mycoplasmatota bacterium WC30]